jgi:putative copper export protein
MNVPSWLGLIVFLLLILSLSRKFNVIAANSLFANIGYSFVPLGLLITCLKSPHSDIQKIASLTIDYWGKFQVTIMAIIIFIFFIAYAEKEVISIVRWWRWRKNS